MVASSNLALGALSGINRKLYMAKRRKALGKGKTHRSKKTAKRLEIKRVMLEEKAKKRKKR